MSLIVKTVTRWLKGFILLYGLYIVLYGHLTPGGGFSGGVIISCAFILLMLAEGLTVCRQTMSRTMAGILDSIGALMFLCVALLGMLMAGVFFKNFMPTEPDAFFTLLSAGTMPWSNIGIGLKVGTGLFLVFAVLSVLNVAVREGKRKMIKRGEQ